MCHCNIVIIDTQVVENMETFRITIISSGEILPPSNVRRFNGTINIALKICSKPCPEVQICECPREISEKVMEVYGVTACHQQWKTYVHYFIIYSK